MTLPTPTALKLLNGNPGNRPIKNEPKPEPATAADIPDWLELSDDDKAHWNRIAPALERLGLLTEADLRALGAYCSDLTDSIKLRSEIRNEGCTVEVTNKHGTTHMGKNPKINVLNEVLDRLRHFENTFGGNPVARTRIHIDEAQSSTNGKPELLDFIGAK